MADPFNSFRLVLNTTIATATSAGSAHLERGRPERHELADDRGPGQLAGNEQPATRLRVGEQQQLLFCDAGAQVRAHPLQVAARSPTDIPVTHGLARAIMGSDAEGVVRAATVPVMLVRGAERD